MTATPAPAALTAPVILAQVDAAIAQTHKVLDLFRKEIVETDEHTFDVFVCRNYVGNRNTWFEADVLASAEYTKLCKSGLAAVLEEEAVASGMLSDPTMIQFANEQHAQQELQAAEQSLYTDQAQVDAAWDRFVDEQIDNAPQMPDDDMPTDDDDYCPDCGGHLAGDGTCPACEDDYEQRIESAADFRGDDIPELQTAARDAHAKLLALSAEATACYKRGGLTHAQYVEISNRITDELEDCLAIGWPLASIVDNSDENSAFQGADGVTTPETMVDNFPLSLRIIAGYRVTLLRHAAYVQVTRWQRIVTARAA